MGGLASPSEETRTKESNRKEIKNNEEDLLPLILVIFSLLRVT
jgi:hypothetical protein